MEKLGATLTGGLPASTRFLLSATDVDKRRSFYKSLQKLGTIEVFDRFDSSKNDWEEQAAALVQRLASERELQISREALELFVFFTAGDRRAIENELEKLDLFLGNSRREVTIELVRSLVPMSRTGVVFELGNALAARDLPHALELLDQLLFQGETPIGILLVAIIPTIRNLLLAKDLLSRNKLTRPAQPFHFGKSLERLPADAVAHLPRKKDGTLNTYALGLAALHTQRYSVSELRAGFAACLEANVQLVTSSLEAKVALSQLLVKIIVSAGK